MKRGDGAFRPLDGTLQAKRGDRLTMRFRLATLGVDRAWRTPSPNAARTHEDIVITVPASGGTLEAGHGKGLDPHFYEPAASGFGGLRAELASMLRSDDLYARIGGVEQRLRLERVIAGPKRHASLER